MRVEGLDDLPLHQVGQGAVEGEGGVLAQPGVEQRAGDDLQREVVHLLGHVEDLAGAPAVGPLLGDPVHDGQVVGHPVRAEGGLDDPAAVAVGAALGHQQAVAEGRLEGVLDGAAGAVVGERDQQRVHESGVGDDADRARAEADPDHIAVPGEGAEEAERVPQQGRGVAESGQCAGGERGNDRSAGPCRRGSGRGGRSAGLVRQDHDITSHQMDRGRTGGTVRRDRSVSDRSNGPALRYHRSRRRDSRVPGAVRRGPRARRCERAHAMGNAPVP